MIGRSFSNPQYRITDSPSSLTISILAGMLRLAVPRQERSPSPTSSDDYSMSDDFDPFSTPLQNPTVAQQLRHLLVTGLGSNRGFSCSERFEDRLKKDVLRTLYASMVGFKPEYLRLLYPNGELADDVDEFLLTKAQFVGSGPSVRDRCCGHVFERGETYYRCKYAFLLRD